MSDFGHLHAADDVDASGSAGAFAAGPCARLEGLLAQAAEDTKALDMSELQALLARLRVELTGLDPSALVARGGLPGLFDGRKRRLQAFRPAYLAAATTAVAAAAELARYAGAITSRREASATLWDQLRESLGVLDAQMVAGQAWLAQQVQRAGAVEKGSAEADARPESEPGLLYTLEDRLAALGLRRRALEHLPALRAARNAEHALPETLLGIQDAVLTWQADWLDALGMAGRRPRNVHPDPARMKASCTAVIRTIDLAEHQLGATTRRMTELEARAAR